MFAAENRIIVVSPLNQQTLVPDSDVNRIPISDSTPLSPRSVYWSEIELYLHRYLFALGFRKRHVRKAQICQHERTRISSSKNYVQRRDKKKLMAKVLLLTPVIHRIWHLSVKQLKNDGHHCSQQ